MNLTITRHRAAVAALSASAEEERELAARLARSEPAAFDQLVERFAPRVVGLATHLLGRSRGAEDVAQDVFLAVLEKPGAFRGQAKLWTYLATVTVNRCRTLRRRRWLHDRLLRAAAPLLGRPPAAELPSELDEQARQVRAAIDALPATYREAVVLRYFEHLTIDEMTTVLAANRNAIEARLSRARKLLKTQLAHLAAPEC